MYRDRWTPVEGEALVCERDASNIVHPYAVAVVNGANVVGHVPRNISACCALFLRPRGSITCIVREVSAILVIYHKEAWKCHVFLSSKVILAS